MSVQLDQGSRGSQVVVFEEKEPTKSDVSVGFGQAFGQVTLMAGATGAFAGATLAYFEDYSLLQGVAATTLGFASTALPAALIGHVAQIGVDKTIQASSYLASKTWDAAIYTLSLPFKGASAAYQAIARTSQTAEK